MAFLSHLRKQDMHKSPLLSQLGRQIHSQRHRMPTLANRVSRPCDVFINHRGIDTKRTVASLLHYHLAQLDVCSFLDSKNMKPGDKLFDHIHAAIKESKIGVAVFSPHYCESYFCLHELALFMETKKKIIPIFCDVKPSELRVVDNGGVPKKEIQRFSLALEEAKYTVGLAFDSHKGNWSDVVTNAAEIVVDSLKELEEKQLRHQIYPKKLRRQIYSGISFPEYWSN